MYVWVCVSLCPQYPAFCVQWLWLEALFWLLPLLQMSFPTRNLGCGFLQFTLLPHSPTNAINLILSASRRLLIVFSYFLIHLGFVFVDLMLFPEKSFSLTIQFKVTSQLLSITLGYFHYSIYLYLILVFCKSFQT